jgi:hypothetical protein
MSNPQAFSMNLDALQLGGRVVRAWHAEYCSVSLLLDDGEVINFSTEESNAGHWFEVFPLRAGYAVPHDVAWTDLASPLHVSATDALWRDEWQLNSEPHDAEQCLGSGPHYTLYSGPIGSAPSGCKEVARVQAGIVLVGDDDRALLVCTSNAAPFKIDFALEPGAIKVLQFEHTRVAGQLNKGANGPDKDDGRRT